MHYWGEPEAWDTRPRDHPVTLRKIVTGVEPGTIAMLSLHIPSLPTTATTTVINQRMGGGTRPLHRAILSNRELAAIMQPTPPVNSYHKLDVPPQLIRLRLQRDQLLPFEVIPPALPATVKAALALTVTRYYLLYPTMWMLRVLLS